MANTSQDIQRQDPEEQKLVKTILDGYLKNREFFSQYQDNQELEHHNKKEQLLTELGQTIKDRFINHQYNSVEITEDHDYGLNYAFYLKDRPDIGPFMYPYHFSLFMDRINDINTIPIREIDLSKIDEYVKKYSQFSDLDTLLLGLTKVWKEISIPLRSRDVEILKIMTDLDFLHKTSDGRPRIHSIDLDEFLEILHLKEGKKISIGRSFRFLYTFGIVQRSYLINAANLGFTYVLTEYPTTHPHIEALRPFILLDTPFKDKHIAIACLPRGNLNAVMANWDLSFYPLWKWNWMINMDQIEASKSGHHWENFVLPDFLSKLSVSASNTGKQWDLTTSLDRPLLHDQLRIIQDLSTLTSRGWDEKTLPEESQNNLHLLPELFEKEILHLYPKIEYLGLTDGMIVKFKCSDKDFFQSLLINLSQFPINHSFSNLHENLIVSYFKLPKEQASNVVKQFSLMKYLLNDAIEIDYELLPKEAFFRPNIDFDKINFEIKDTEAYLKWR